MSVGVVAGVVAYLELFRALDYGHGIVRALLLVGLAGAACWLLGRVERGAGLGPSTWMLLPAALVAMLVNLVAGGQAISRTVATHEIQLDQGQNTFRAIQYLRLGANPYGRSALLDPASYSELVTSLQRHPSCLVRPSSSAWRAAFRRYWLEVSRPVPAVVMPAIADNPECQTHQRALASLGYKYGPALLAFYAPFVWGFDKPGIFVAHIVLVLLATWLLAWFGRNGAGFWTGSWPLAAGGALLFLAPSHLRHNVLASSASDLGPTLAAVAAVVCLTRGKDGWAAFLIGVSVACKVLPGLIYVPLLLSCRRRTWAVGLVPVLAAYVPFLAWDAQGFVNNTFLFNLGRPADSTALAFSISGTTRALVQVAGLAAACFSLNRACKQAWTLSAVLSYLWVAHVAVLLSGPIFHNNYLVWLLPLLSLTYVAGNGSTARAETSASEAATLRSPVP